LHGTVLAGILEDAAAAVEVDIPVDVPVRAELELLGDTVLTPTEPLPQDSSKHKASQKLNAPARRQLVHFIPKAPMSTSCERPLSE
jgi:hypothetical protein